CSCGTGERIPPYGGRPERVPRRSPCAFPAACLRHWRFRSGTFSVPRDREDVSLDLGHDPELGPGALVAADGDTLAWEHVVDGHSGADGELQPANLQDARHRV